MKWRRAPSAIFGAAVLLASVGLWLTVLTRSTPLPASEYGFRASGVIFVLSFGGVGAVLASRVPRNPVGWVLCWMGFASAVQFLGRSYENYGVLAHPGSVPGAVYGAWVDSWIWLPGIIGMLPLLLLFFPDGRLQSRRWRTLVWVVAITLPLATVSAAFAPGALENAALANPVGLRGAAGGVAKALNIAIFMLQLSILPAVVAFVLRFRATRGVQREQMKWLAAAAVFCASTFVAFFASQKTPDVSFVKLMEDLTVIAIATVPVAVGVAVLRYRLYDIDRIISRTVSYAVLTGVLIGAYVGLVISFDQVTRPIAGRSDLAVAASTLIVAALFVPLRRRVQQTVDRRFNRQRYDAAELIDSFSARLRDEVDIDTLTIELKAIIARTMQPELLSVWLRGTS
jgi:hypothetical protein